MPVSFYSLLYTYIYSKLKKKKKNKRLWKRVRCFKYQKGSLLGKLKQKYWLAAAGVTENFRLWLVKRPPVYNPA